MEYEILTIAKRIQALSQSGLWYARDQFDKERYEELRELSVQLAELVCDAPIEKIRNLYTADKGFQTPKVDIRAVVLKGDKVLLTRERSDNCWSLPGGFADVNFSPRTVAEKEVLEETGIIAKSKRVLAILDTHKQKYPPLEFHYYKIILLCDILGGELRGSNETLEAGFFSFDDLPELSIMRNTYETMALLRKQLDCIEPYCD